MQMMKFLHNAQNDALRLSVGHGSIQPEWHVDALFAVHPDCRGHTGVAFGFKHGGGFPMQMSRKQKLNAGGGTTCKPVGVDDVPPKIPWTPLFLKEQGCDTMSDEVCQDNASAVPSEEN